MASYKLLQSTKQIQVLKENISLFNELTLPIKDKINSTSAIHCFVIKGNENVIQASKELIAKGFDVRAIKSPTVKEGSERLRICLHATNTKNEITNLTKELNALFKIRVQ